MPSSRALSNTEKKAAARLLAGVPDGEVTKMEATETAQRPHVRDVLVEALARIGVGPDKLAKVLAEGLDAEKTIAVGVMAINVRDHPTRHKFLETALNVVGAGGMMEHAPPPSNVFVFRSFLSERPVDVKIGAPTDAIVSRRLNAAKVRNRVNV